MWPGSFQWLLFPIWLLLLFWFVRCRDPLKLISLIDSDYKFSWLEHNFQNMSKSNINLNVSILMFMVLFEKSKSMENESRIRSTRGNFNIFNSTPIASQPHAVTQDYCGLASFVIFQISFVVDFYFCISKQTNMALWSARHHYFHV